MRFCWLVLFSIASLSLSSCGTQLYWVKTGATNQQTASDLHLCRISVQPLGGNQVYSAVDLERSCMGSKGYSLSDTPGPDRELFK